MSLKFIGDNGGANRLKTVNGSAASYGYDGDGMKSRQTSGGNAIFYARSSVLGNVAMEVNAAAGVYRAYVYAGGKLVAQRSYDGQFYWMHQDHLGSGRKMTDATGAVKYRAEFDPYGQLVLSWSSSGYDNLNSKRFTGYERDTAAGLDYANARMYSASGAGRFMQPDPIGLKAADLKRLESLNRYSYVQNDPVNFVDPTGALLQAPDGSSGGTCQSIFVTTGWEIDQLTGDRLSFGFTYTSCLAAPNFGGGGNSPADALTNGPNQNRGQRVPLFGQKLAEFNEARSKAIKLLGDPSSDCAKFLDSRGLSPVEFATTLSAMIPYDALLSTNIDSFGLFVGRVNDVFKQISIASAMPDAAVNDSGTAAYFTSSGLTVTIEMHETFHMIRPGISDADFYRKLGGSSADYSKYGSRAINTLLEKEGCK